MIENIESFTFNGVDIAEEFTNEDTGEYLIVNSVSGRGLLPAAPNLITVTRRHGAYFESSYLPERILGINFTIKSASFSKLRKDLERINEIINTGEEGEIVFADEPDRAYYGTVAEVSSEMEISHIAAISFVFVCADPFKYGEEKTINFPPTGVLTFENNGTSETEPIIELYAKDKATFAMASNSEGEYNLIGKPADVETEVVDERIAVISERGETINEWSDVGTNVDGGDVSGLIATDGTGIVVSGYGTGSRWHGPAVMKEITPIQDFEVEMRLRVEAVNPKATYRIEFYLFDENMTSLGKMAIMDSLETKVRYVAEGRAGPFEGKGNNYLISSQNYLREREHFHGMLRMKRIGNKFEFYVARIGHNEEGFLHHDSLTKTYIDAEKLFQGKLKYIQIHIAKYGNSTNAKTPRINAIEVFERNELTVDQTPYILDVGDVVTFDHKTKDILLNGESRKDLKDFGGSFFALEKGTNTLAVSPEGVFDTSIKYRNKYL